MIGARSSSMVERVVNSGAGTPSMMGRQLDGVPRARKRRRRLSSSFLGDGASTIGARTTSSMVKHCHCHVLLILLFFLYRKKVVNNDMHVSGMCPPMIFNFTFCRKPLPTHSSIHHRGRAHEGSTQHIFMYLPLYRGETQKFRVLARHSV